LAAVLVGEDPASISFLKQKEKTAKELGVDFRLYKFPKEIKNDPLREEVLKISKHKTCGGVVVQLPLPEHLNKHYILNVIPREKDVDVLGERALGAFYTGRNPVLPPALGAVEKILKALDVRCEMFKVAVVGAGFLVGKVIVTWLLGKVRELYVLDRGSDFKILKEVDIVITGVGEAGLINVSMLKPGALVIDFGYDRGRGDFDSERSQTNNGSLAFTPTPGGTGPILVLKIFENFYSLN
jgi:methylenetetrahydrofolate dehydrogenase (NADP+)/methenyltetrahydrofolate cyclohydrolase